MGRTSETRLIQGIHGVDLTGFGELTITQGTEEALVIEAEESMLPLVKTQVDGGVLVIRVIPGWGW